MHKDTAQTNHEGKAPMQPEARATDKRPCVAAMDALLEQKFPVLDHGFVRVVDYMGDDHAVVQAARVSYGTGTKKLREDRGLIRYLMRHQHSTPFEMCEIKLHIKLPIFIARQWVRHRTANINEYSARYSMLDREFYIPEIDQLASQSSSNRQGRGASLDPAHARAIQNILREDAAHCYKNYQQMLGSEAQEDTTPHTDESAKNDKFGQGYPGISRELARMNLTLNTYTQWYWKIDLHNLLHFLKLRADSHAQYEIRVYAETILDIVKQWVPLVYEAFCDYQLGAVKLSAPAWKMVKAMIAGGNPKAEDYGLSPREWRDLQDLLS